jgi:hypothetical protein
MSETTNDAHQPADDRTADEIEADIAETRERLAESVDALAAKVDVKAQAKEKVGEAKAQAKEKVEEATARAKDKTGQAKEQVVVTSRSLVDRFKAASRPVQVAIGAAPLVLLILIIVRRSNR